MPNAEEVRKLKRSEYATFLDTTPTEDAETYIRMGKGISEMEESYNPEEASEQYIDEDTPTNSVESYSPAFDASQRCYLGEKIFEFVDEMRMKLATGSDAETSALKVYLYRKLAENVYKAQKINCTIVINSFSGKEIGYAVKQNGNPIDGYVTISAGKVTFTAGEYTA